jgi:acyl-CoA reductase-like NAD-dependent aldehyde dehydrogenase
MAVETGKPVTQGRAEVTRTVALLEAAMRRATDPLEASCGVDSVMRFRPVGVISIVTPWNNPLAIPLGKIGPALFYGNTVVWKPAPAGSPLAVKMMELLRLAGCPAGVVNVVSGDRSTALALMADPRVDAVTFTGSSAAGYWAQDICARRRVPLQAELGGNNAAIIWRDCDLEEAAFQVAEAAFGFAGQRCTANRRVVVDSHCYDAFLKHLEPAVAGLVWDDPLNDPTQVGPLISLEARSRVAALVERAKPAAEAVLVPHRADSNYDDLSRKGAYLPPTVICCNDTTHEVVQEETFGPVLVVQQARDWSQAMHLCNGVKQGLVAALFSRSKELQKRFLEEAQAGILKINTATAGADAEAPFGGWKASGVGPPEHGISNREFYTRTQSIYTH